MSDAKATIAARTWSPSSWRSLESLQMASYEAADTPEKIFDKLSKLPPLVQSTEVDALKELLAAAARGERFIVQGGDCAERFMDCETDRLWRQLGVLFQMGEIVSKSTGKGAVRIARIAGQYGKPRSKPTEVVEGHGEIMSFKGDNINGYPVEERKWDPKRLLEGYFHSAATLNYLRGVVSSGGLECLAELDVGHLASRADYADCQAVAKEVQSARGSGYEGIFTSHEAMQLDLEEALTRAVGPNHYNLSAHMVWIGDRTRQLLGGHVEYFRGISNPVGCKVGPSMKNDELTELVQILNPNKEEGKLVLITRYGHDKIDGLLPGHIEAVKASGVPVVWQCDGVHGNTVTAKSVGLKTRAFDDVMSECTKALAIHKAAGTTLAGVHLELTGQATVTECLGGSAKIDEAGLKVNYETYCDPRLNYSQAIEAAFTLANAIGAKAPAAKKAKK
jgi:3-deoxy-7-phosphoheptulonate synthase